MNWLSCSAGGWGKLDELTDELGKLNEVKDELEELKDDFDELLS